MCAGNRIHGISRRWLIAISVVLAAVLLIAGCLDFLPGRAQADANLSVSDEALTELLFLQGTVLDSVQWAFAYVLVGDNAMEQNFSKSCSAFDAHASAFETAAGLNATSAPGLYASFEKMRESHDEFVDTARALSSVYGEQGTVSWGDVAGLERDVDELCDNLNSFTASYILAVSMNARSDEVIYLDTVSMLQIHDDLVDGVEDVYACLLLGEEEQQLDFKRRMGDIRKNAASYQNLPPYNDFLAAQEDVEKSALAIFEYREKTGTYRPEDVKAFALAVEDLRREFDIMANWIFHPH